MPKYLNTRPGSLESAVIEAVSPAQQAAIAIAKKEKGEKPKNEGSKEEYEKFFKSALKKFGVDSPADFKSDEEKKKFFDYVDKNYKGEGEKSEEVKEEVSLAERAANHITDLWKEASGAKKEEKHDKKESDEKTMTGKPMSKIEVAPSDQKKGK